MKGLGMEIDWRTVQLFVGSEGVSEVSIDSEDNLKARCTCQVFAKRKNCKHTKWVKDRIKQNDGNFAIQISDTVPDEEAYEALGDADTFRKFILKYATVEYID